jgi:hypothetical protein
VVGAVAPLIQWAIQKKYKVPSLRYLNFPIIFGGIGAIQPGTPLNCMAWVFICFLFHYVIRRRHTLW